MANDSVVDTGALISWPISKLIGSIASPKQKKELGKFYPARLEIINAIDIIWRTPKEESINKVINIGKNTGDIAGLSPVDIEILALASEDNYVLFTDDYRMQNLAEFMGIKWHAIETEGIKEVWSWEIVCKGCKKIQPDPKSPLMRKNLRDCEDCGSEVKLRRKK
ncbi:MAG: rRNA maturation endonuclease Nob1 [Candidatus Thalassarchaeaceae archaeon]|jgi:rRNA maturation endonuclease Nob1